MELTDKHPPLTDRQLQNFKAKYKRKKGCWEWTANKDKKGYGLFQLASSGGHRAHRVMWFVVHGSIPHGMSVLHRCDNPPCVRPSHLFLGDSNANNKDRAKKGRSAKIYGQDHGMAKLTNSQVAEIRRLYTGKRGEQTALSKQFNVSITTVHYIVHGYQRKHG